MIHDSYRAEDVINKPPIRQVQFGRWLTRTERRRLPTCIELIITGIIFLRTLEQVVGFIWLSVPLGSLLVT